MRMNHNKITNSLEEKGFERINSHYYKRGNEEVFLCGSCSRFKYKVNEKEVKNLDRNSHEQVMEFIDNLYKLCLN